MYRPNEKKYLVTSGLFVSILLAISFLTVFLLNKENPLFSSKIDVFVEVKNAQNLKNGAAVQLKGIKIGTVQEIKFKTLDLISIRIGILNDYAEWVKTDSYVAFKTQGVLGDKFLEILGGTESAPGVKGKEVLRIDEVSTFDQIINKSEDLMAVAGNILQKIDKFLGPIEANRFERILFNLEQVSGNTNKLLTSMNDQKLNQSLANLNEATKTFKSTSESFANISKRIEDGPGTLHSIIYDQTVHEDLRSLLGGANRNKVLKYFLRESIKKGDEN